MIKHGEPPYLECSSRGDKRFSAFYARAVGYRGSTIEQVYQSAKVFEDGSTGLTVRQAKGRKAVNQEYCNELYSKLWDRYIEESKELQEVLVNSTGVSDIFGQLGHCCQATELWRIRAKYVTTMKDRHDYANGETRYFT